MRTIKMPVLTMPQCSGKEGEWCLIVPLVPIGKTPRSTQRTPPPGLVLKNDVTIATNATLSSSQTGILDFALTFPFQGY